MLSPLLGRCGVFAAASTRYSALHGNNLDTPLAAETNGRSVMAGSGSFLNWFVQLSASPGGTSGSSGYRLTLYKNGSTTGLTLTITTPATTGSVSAVVPYTDGDLFTVEAVPVNTPTASPSGSWSLDVSADGQPLLTGDLATLSNAAATFLSLQNSEAFTTRADADSIIPTAGTIDRLQFYTNTLPASGKTWKATLVLNGSDTALTCTITNAGGVLASDTSHAITVARGDKACWRIDPTGTPTAARLRVGARFSPTTAGESIQTFTTSNSTGTATGNNFAGISGNTVFSTTESVRANWLGSSYVLKNLHAEVTTAPGGVKAWAVTARSNAGNTTLACTITGAATSNNDLSHAPAATATALLGFNFVGSGTPANTPAKASLVTYKAPTTVAVGQAVETDSAQTITPSKRVAVGQASESETAQHVAATKRVAVGQAAEVDSAQTLSPTKRIAVGQASEVESAQTVSPAKRVAVGQATETDSAQALNAAKRVAIGQATETDAAQTVSPVKRVAVGQATETDIAQIIAAAKRVAVGQASEVDEALPIVGPTPGTPDVDFAYDVATPLPDVATTVIPIVVARNYEILGVRLSLYLTHTYDSDLRISLRHPGGVSVLLFDRQGASGDNIGSGADEASRCIFDPAATTAIADGSAPFVGGFVPDGDLGSFVGLESMGTWELVIQDVAGGDVGTFHDATLHIRAGALLPVRISATPGPMVLEGR